MPEVIKLKNTLFDKKKIELDVLRLDKIHPIISGNKWYKLKYNIEVATKGSYERVITFGGAYSNHIAATAEACRLAGVASFGLIRGEEVDNPTLRKAKEAGMQLEFISRSEFRELREKEGWGSIDKRFPNSYIIPEGGSNELGVKGAEEILEGIGGYQNICCAVGTGGTISGLIRSSNVEIIGVPGLKNSGFLEEDIKGMVRNSDKRNWQLVNKYHFGGYAKFSHELINFINSFREEYGIQLDPIYTGKVFFGIFDLIKNDFFKPDSRILAIHTGGLQGIKGFEARYGLKISK